MVWDASGVLDLDVRPNVLLGAKHLHDRDHGITGAYHTALAVARREQGARLGELTSLYLYFLASTIRAVEATQGPPREFAEPLGHVD